MYCLSNKDEFQCKSDECIKWSYVCDGISHCSNRADEDCDMCTNDLYLCKDSSRINCTLACSTLGYIPCRNYVDKKICASVNRKSSGRFFSLKSSSSGSDGGDFHSSDGRFQTYDELNAAENNNNLFFKNININEKFLFSVLGVFVFASLIVLLVLFGLFYNRNKRKKKQQALSARFGNNANDDAQNQTAANFRSVSESSSLSNSHQFDVILDENGAKKYSSLGKNAHVEYNELILTDIVYDPNENVHISAKKTKQIHLTEAMDYHQLYGEPPPSYKLAKYYPKANINLNAGSQSQSPTSVEPLLKSQRKEDEDKNSHIYENIDEVNHGQHQKSIANQSTNTSATNNDELDYGNGKSAAAKRKRARFQALKKHSSTNNNTIKTNRQSSNSNSHSPSDSISDPNDRSLTLVTNSTSTSSVTSSKSSHAAKHYLKSGNVLIANKSSSEQFL